MSAAAPMPVVPDDLVCHRSVPMRSTTPRAVFQGKSYYFCSTSCEAKFKAQPQRYAYAPAWVRREATKGAHP